MDYLHEIAFYFNSLSDKADKIKKLDRDKYKHFKDMQLLDELLDEKIEELENNINNEEIEIYKNALKEILDLRNRFEYTDEWKEAEAFNKSEEIAKEALKL